MKEVLVKDFEEFFAKHGRYYSEFYVGIAADPKDTLFNRHSVNEKRDAWIHSNNALLSSTVRDIEQLFLARGAKGGPGGGDSSTRYVYAYKIAPHTRG